MKNQSLKNAKGQEKRTDKKKKVSTAGDVPCRNPGLNQGPLDLQSNALPTELFRLTSEEVLYNNIFSCANESGDLFAGQFF